MRRGAAGVVRGGDIRKPLCNEALRSSVPEVVRLSVYDIPGLHTDRSTGANERNFPAGLQGIVRDTTSVAKLHRRWFVGDSDFSAEVAYCGESLWMLFVFPVIAFSCWKSMFRFIRSTSFFRDCNVMVLDA